MKDNKDKDTIITIASCSLCLDFELYLRILKPYLYKDSRGHVTCSNCYSTFEIFINFILSINYFIILYVNICKTTKNINNF